MSGCLGSTALGEIADISQSMHPGTVRSINIHAGAVIRMTALVVYSLPLM